MTTLPSGWLQAEVVLDCVIDSIVDSPGEGSPGVSYFCGPVVNHSIFLFLNLFLNHHDGLTVLCDYATKLPL